MSFLQGLSGNFLQRLAGGQANYEHPQDAQYTNQVLGGVPQNIFQQHATNALRHTDASAYQNHITPGVGGTNPLGGYGAQYARQHRGQLAR